jgi:hypothetical protein
MSKAFTLDQLAEGIRERHLGTEARRLLEKWNRTGLLRGLDGVKKENMARLLENQTAQILKEANSIGAGAGSSSSSGDIRGFTNIAFPIVRRVFGGLVANDLVSIQPMSLPSGLLFYLDYTYGTNRGAQTGIDGNDTVGAAATYSVGQSIYNNPAGRGIQSGSLGTGGQYDLIGSAYSKVHSGSALRGTTEDTHLLASGAYGSGTTLVSSDAGATLSTSGSDGRLLQFDPGISNLIEQQAGKFFAIVVPFKSATGGPFNAQTDSTMVKEFGLTVVGGVAAATVSDLGTVGQTVQGGTSLVNVRRLNQLGTWDSATNVFTANGFVQVDDTNAAVLMIVSGTKVGLADYTKLHVSFPIGSTLNTPNGDASTLVIPVFESNFNSTSPSPTIPEIDIKIESISVVATTRKLRARWSPELAQDLNAYHSLDAEVELTQILSEQIALELDREILNDLLTTGTGANFFWSRAPGKFVNKQNGAEVSRATSLTPGPAFTGTVREWYETLIETVIDVANEIHRKTLRGSANFIVVSPDVATILEASVLYKPVYSIDGSGQVGSPMTIGAEKIGTLSNRFTVYKDPYFPRNKILVGFKGGSYLETGYVYAPYVPLIVTPTIFAPEDFTPRKGVMTRYGKKMVRSDFYGTVTCLDMNII